MKEIFIVSSSEALPQVEQIANVLSEIKGIKPIKWNSVFDPGYIVFETIEKISMEVCGAIILATPDDDLEIRKRKVKVPRTNSMIEFGYFSAILGRKNVAVCKYDNVEIASDLSGFNYIAMGKFISDALIQEAALKKLTKWVSALPDVANQIPLTQLLHGYSGRWQVKSTFQIWRGRDLSNSNGDYAQFSGTLDLTIPRNGKGGFGTLYSTMNLEIGKFIMEVFFIAEVRKLVVSKEGDISFETEIIAREIKNKEGEPPQTRGVREKLRGERTALWSLKPSSTPRALSGEFNITTGDEKKLDLANTKIYKM